MSSPVHTIDVAHPPRHPDVVEDELLRASLQVKSSTTLRVLKIIHGHGSTGKGGSTKSVVLNWLFRNRSKFRLIISGAEYNTFDANTQNMRKDVGPYSDADLETPNPGITVVWVR